MIASNFGRRRQPGWYHNLRAHPDAAVTVDGDTSAVRAVEVTGAVRDRVWRERLAVFPGWSTYQHRATGRDIAVFVLTTPG